LVTAVNRSQAAAPELTDRQRRQRNIALARRHLFVRQRGRIAQAFACDGMK
jgi:hypothetical protein